MNIPPDAQPQPGQWVSKAAGFPTELVAIQQGVCWYRTSKSHNLHPMSVTEWLEQMRPVTTDGNV